LTDRDILNEMREDIREMKKSIEGLLRFERKALENYVTIEHCERNRQGCLEQRKMQEQNFKWGVGIILTLGALTISALVALGGWATGK